MQRQPKRPHEVCPIERILYRTPYFVLPRLAIQAMPLDWRRRFAVLIDEAATAGLETPDYIVYRDDPEFTLSIKDEDDPYVNHGAQVLLNDPWADYRRGHVPSLCPGFDPPKDPDPTDQHTSDLTA